MDLGWRDSWTGAIHGATVFAAYWVAELVFVSISPFFFEPQGAAFTTWHVVYSGACLVVYVGAGGALGALLGPVARLVGPLFRLNATDEIARLLQVALTLSLVAAFLDQLVSGETAGDMARLGYALCVVLSAALVLRAAGVMRAGWLERLAGPWCVSVLLAGVPWWWQTLRFRPVTDQVLGGLFIVGLLAPGAVVGGRFRMAEPGGRVALPIRDAALAGGAAVAVLVLGVLLDWTWTGRFPSPEISGGAKGKPDVVMIVMDTVRADRTSLHGYQRDTTPNLRQLAKQSTVFRQAVATSNYTLPAHASLFTGLHPRRHGAHRDRDVPQGPLQEEFVTVAEILKNHGYLTAAVSANGAYVTPDWGMGQGFSVFRYHTTMEAGHYLRRKIRRLFERSPVPVLNRFYLSAEDINRQVFSIFDALKSREEPYFLFVNYMDAHGPLSAPQKFVEPYAGAGQQRLSTRRWRRMGARVRNMEGGPTGAEAAILAAEYDGAITYIDHCIGALVRHLEQTGRMDNTVVIVTSDHGEAFGENSIFEHGFSLYQHQVHVPLLIKYPGRSESREVAGPVSHVDLMPTVLESVGLEAPTGIDGRSLLGQGESMSRPVFTASFPLSLESRQRVPRRYSQGEHAVYFQGLKLIAFPNEDPEIYRLNADDQERNDLFASGSRDSAANLLGTLDAWLQATPKYRRKGQVADERILERLRALGYVH